jgi:hypothetical protein
MVKMVVEAAHLAKLILSKHSTSKNLLKLTQSHKTIEYSQHNARQDI